MKLLTVTLSMLLFISGYSQQNCLVLSLPFNGNANDQSGNNLNGAVNGASLVADRFGTLNSAYSFDGVDDFISVANDALINFDVNDDFSISLWVKAPMQQTNTSSPANEIFTKWEDNGGGNQGYPFALRLFNDTHAQEGKIRVVRFDKNCSNVTRATTTSTLNDNTFHHLVYIKNGVSIYVYVDNSLEGSFMDSSACNTTNSNDLYIGKVGGSNSPNHFEGQIDDIYIYNCALTANQVDSLFYDGAPASTYATINPTECTSYTSPSGNYNWTVSGTYMDTIPNSQGGDSIITINLTVNQPSSASISHTECTEYVSPSGNYTWTTNGTYMDTIVNGAGCDSILTINLTINNSTSATLTELGCGSYTLGSETYTTSGTYNQVTTNAAGCDSNITLNLTIINPETNVTLLGNTLSAVATGVDYLWLDCNNNFVGITGAIVQSYTASSTGDYAVQINDQGCLDTSACFNVTIDGIIDHGLKSLIAVYPNPGSGYYTVDLSQVNGEVSLTVYNMHGQEMLRQKESRRQTINLALEAPAGVYYLTVNNRSQQVTLRLVKL